MTKLVDACKAGNVRFIMSIMNSGHDINELNEQKLSPLSVSCKENNLKLAELLIKKGADVNIKDGSAPSPLYFAVQNDNFELVKTLVESGADTNSIFESYTPLMIAIENKNLGMIKLLLENGADVNTENKFGITPLMLACLHCGHSIVIEILKRDINPNKTMFTGKNAAHFAAENNKLDVIKLLGVFCVDLLKEDDFGRSSLDFLLHDERSTLVTSASCTGNSRADKRPLEYEDDYLDPADLVGCKRSIYSGIPNFLGDSEF